MTDNKEFERRSEICSMLKYALSQASSTLLREICHHASILNIFRQSQCCSEYSLAANLTFAYHGLGNIRLVDNDYLGQSDV